MERNPTVYESLDKSSKPQDNVFSFTPDMNLFLSD